MEPYGENFSVFYDRFFGDYAEKASPVLLGFLARRVPRPGPARVLDLGCGTGRLALHLLEAGYEVTGLDLSKEMLALAEVRCARHLVSGAAKFLQGDMADLRLEGPFQAVLSTYNSMNHLGSPEGLSSCFRSVRRCLAGGAPFLFDYHTAKGLREWDYSESARWEEGEVRTSGHFDPSLGKAVMRLEGSYRGREVEEVLENTTFPLAWVGERLREAGFPEVHFAQMLDLERPLRDPESEKRVAVIAR